jgi:predicted dehydrogenase
VKTVKWGIIGTGHIASKFTTGLRSMKNVEITAVASRNPDRAKLAFTTIHL